MRFITRLLGALVLFAAATVTSATELPPIPAPPELPVKGFILFDFNSGTVLAESNADERLEPASLTKIMSAYVVFRELGQGKLALDDLVMVSEQAWRTGGSKMFIEVGKHVRVEDLLLGMIVQSGNDASVALAEHIAGSVQTFANLMNTHAKRLGMTNSHFTNPHGLPDPDLYTTARDIGLVAMAMIHEFPEYYRWYSNREFTYNDITQHNRNPLLSRDPSADGVKTGHTQAAGYCLVGSAKRDDMRLVSVVMGSPTPRARADASLALLNYGFRFYESHRLYPAGEALDVMRVWKGAQSALPAGPATDVFATIPRGRYAQLSARLEKAPNPTAPVAAGDPLGEIIVSFADTEVTRVPLVALESIPEGGLWPQIRDTLLNLF